MIALGVNNLAGLTVGLFTFKLDTRYKLKFIFSQSLKEKIKCKSKHVSSLLVLYHKPIQMAVGESFEKYREYSSILDLNRIEFVVVRARNQMELELELGGQLPKNIYLSCKNKDNTQLEVLIDWL